MNLMRGIHAKIVLLLVVPLTIFFSALLVLLLFPVSMVLERVNLSYTDISGSKVSDGDLWLDIDQLSDAARVLYYWCPDQGLKTWCISINNDDLSISGRVEPMFDGGLIFEDIQVQFLHLGRALKSNPMVDGNLIGDINKLKLESLDCPLANLSEITGELELGNMSILGISLGNHELVLNTNNDEISANLQGQTLVGEIDIVRPMNRQKSELNSTKPSYSAEGTMLVPQGLESLARSFMRHIEGNKYGWVLEGVVPC